MNYVKILQKDVKGTTLWMNEWIFEWMNLYFLFSTSTVINEKQFNDENSAVVRIEYH